MMTPYEQAAQRFENISRNFKTITDAASALIEWVNREYDQAQDGLRQYEVRPGVPKAEYRGQDHLDDINGAWPDGCPIPFDIARAALQTRLSGA